MTTPQTLGTRVTPTSAPTADRHAQWRDEAACRDMDPEVFFTPDEASREAAFDTCRRCPVRQPCLEHALMARELHGIWGGTDENQRQRLLRSGRRAA